MNELKKLEPLFESETIKPTFNYVHVILALFLFEQNPKGIGRYRLKEELLIGSGTAKSLVKRLKKNIGFIKVSDENGITDQENLRKGHVLTDHGLKFSTKIREKIPLLEKGDIKILEEIIIDHQNTSPYICLVKDAANKISSGIEQRDAAIKVNGSGATCLIHDGIELTFPTADKIKVSEKVQKYLNSMILGASLEIKRNDVIIIGLGENLEKARIAALNAALSLLE